MGRTLRAPSSGCQRCTGSRGHSTSIMLSSPAFRGAAVLTLERARTSSPRCDGPLQNRARSTDVADARLARPVRTTRPHAPDDVISNSIPNPTTGGLTATAPWKATHNEPSIRMTSVPAHDPCREQGDTDRRCRDGKVWRQPAIVGIADHEDREPQCCRDEEPHDRGTLVRCYRGGPGSEFSTRHSRRRRCSPD